MLTGCNSENGLTPAPLPPVDVNPPADAKVNEIIVTP